MRSSWRHSRRGGGFLVEAEAQAEGLAGRAEVEDLRLGPASRRLLRFPADLFARHGALRGDLPSRPARAPFAAPAAQTAEKVDCPNAGDRQTVWAFARHGLQPSDDSGARMVAARQRQRPAGRGGRFCSCDVSPRCSSRPARILAWGWSEVEDPRGVRFLRCLTGQFAHPSGRRGTTRATDLEVGDPGRTRQALRLPIGFCGDGDSELDLAALPIQHARRTRSRRGEIGTVAVF